jgi:hypothetical protein
MKSRHISTVSQAPELAQMTTLEIKLQGFTTVTDTLLPRGRPFRPVAAAPAAATATPATELATARTATPAATSTSSPAQQHEFGRAPLWPKRGAAAFCLAP